MRSQKTLYLLSVLLSVGLALPVYSQSQPSPKTRELLSQAESMFRSGKFEDALLILSQAERLDPKNVAIVQNKGETLLALMRFEEAAASFGKLVSINGQIANGHWGLCRAYPPLGKVIEAIDECRTAIRLNPNEPEFQVALSRLYLGNKRTTDAISLLESGLQKFREDVAILTALYQAYKLDGNLARAEETLVHISQLLPKNGSIYGDLADVYLKQGRNDQAIAAGRKFVELEPNNFTSYLTLGQILKDAGFYQESIEYLLRAVQMNPNCGPGYLSLSDSYETIGDKENALGSLRHAYRLLPASFQIASRLGSALVHYSLYTEAVEPLERAMSFDSNSFDVNVMLGLAYSQSGQFSRALDRLSHANQILPNDSNVRMFAGIARSRQSMVEHFDKIYNDVQMNPDDVKARVSLAWVYHFKNQPSQAEEQFLQVIKLRSNDFNAYNEASVFFGETGQFEKALIYARKASDLNPHHVLFMQIALYELRFGRINEALAAAQRSVQIKATLPESQIVLGDILLKLGKREEALASYRTAFDLSPESRVANLKLAWLYIAMANKEGALRHFQILKRIAPAEVADLGRCLRAHFRVPLTD